MFIIYGWRRTAQVLAVLTLVCQRCSSPAEHVLRRLTTKVTLFFIPLFPVSRKHILTCTSCQAESRLSREQAEQLAASAQPPFQAPQQQYPQQQYPQQPYGYQQGPPPMRQPYPGQPQGYPQLPGGYPYPPGR